jgi:hypothetical protein
MDFVLSVIPDTNISGIWFDGLKKIVLSRQISKDVLNYGTALAGGFALYEKGRVRLLYKKQ